jgi:hypothetical protein
MERLIAHDLALQVCWKGSVDPITQAVVKEAFWKLPNLSSAIHSGYYNPVLVWLIIYLFLQKRLTVATHALLKMSHVT